MFLNIHFRSQVMFEKSVEIACLDKTIEMDSLEKTEINIPEEHLECCGNYLQGVVEIDRFVKYVSIRNQNDIYRGKRFDYCPWCGAKK